MRTKDLIDEIVEKILGRKVSKGFLQYFRYLICGGIATVTDVGILFVLTHFLHINYLVVAAASFLCGITVNYTLNTILVFQSSGKIKKEVPVFAMIGLGGLVWTELIIWTLTDKLKIYLLIAKLIAIVVVLQWNFFMRKKFVFYPEPIPGDNIEKL
jgi:putative flippase GtrA